MLTELLRGLWQDGEVRFEEPPSWSAADLARATELLRWMHADARLEVAGPLLEFDARVAVSAAQLLGWACWFLVRREARPDEVEARLQLPPPRTAEQHLAGDLTLRYLPQVHRRSRLLAAADVLTTSLERTLRGWPLAGVLADLADSPLTDLEFGGHPGLLLLYAERWVETEKDAWLPRGRGGEYLELVLAERGPRTEVWRQRLRDRHVEAGERHEH